MGKTCLTLARIDGGNLEITERKRVCASSEGKKQASKVQNHKDTSPSKKGSKIEGEGTEIGIEVGSEGRAVELRRGRVEERTVYGCEVEKQGIELLMGAVVVVTVVVILEIAVCIPPSRASASTTAGVSTSSIFGVCVDMLARRSSNVM